MLKQFSDFRLQIKPLHISDLLLAGFNKIGYSIFLVLAVHVFGHSRLFVNTCSRFLAEPQIGQLVN